MTLQGLALTVAVLAGCTKASAEKAAPTPAPAPAPKAGVKWAAPPPPTAPATRRKPAVAIELTSVTLADDCGGTAPHTGPTLEAKRRPQPRGQGARRSDAAPEPGARSRARRRCEQTSMQLSITAARASRIQVKSVELFGEDGTSLGKLSPSKPTRWSVAASTYQPWDQKVAAGTTANISYVLAQPDWGRIGNRWNRTYTLKTIVSVGGVDRTAQKEVSLSAPASLPPNVRT